MKASTKTAGNVTIEELDDYAKYVAVNNMKELLYDASSRSNLQDALRIIMPFAPAWKEVIGTYAGFLKKNPIGSARSFQRIYTGIANADPDNDGRGFFYNDPVTNAMTFMFPASGALAKAITGLVAPLKAPLQRLKSQPSITQMITCLATKPSMPKANPRKITKVPNFPAFDSHAN